MTASKKEGGNVVDQAVRALVVEDDFSWRQLLSEILSDMGMEVDQASSYSEAVEALRGRPHRLAILDLSLGGTDHHNQDGIRVAETVRRQDPGCVVLFLTGFATVELAVQVMQSLGAFTCLRKEAFRRAEFRKVINQALAQAPAAALRSAAASPAGSIEIEPAALGNVLVETESGALISGAKASSIKDNVSLSEDGDPNGETRSVLVIEDDAGWRALLSELLNDAGCVVRTSASYVEAIGLIKREHFDLAVVDLSLASSLSQENMDGYRLLSGLQKAGVPVIVVSGYVDPAKIEQAYSERLIFVCMEKQAFDRKAFVSNVQNAIQAQAQDPLFASLTEREREVLGLLARGLTNKEIGAQLFITPNTVKRHLKSLFAKLGVNTRSAASAQAISMGLGEKK